MSGTVLTIGKGDDPALFGETIKSGLVLVDFFATWCRPCRMQSPIIEEIAEEFKGQVQFLKIDADAHQDIASKYGISSVPTLIMMKDGAEVERFAGLQQAAALRASLKKAV